MGDIHGSFFSLFFRSCIIFYFHCFERFVGCVRRLTKEIILHILAWRKSAHSLTGKMTIEVADKYLGACIVFFLYFDLNCPAFISKVLQFDEEMEHFIFSSIIYASIYIPIRYVNLRVICMHVGGIRRNPLYK